MCLLDNQVQINDDGYYKDGYCRFQRKNKPSSLSEFYDQESKCSLILPTNNLYDIESILNSVQQNKDQVNQVVIINQGSHTEEYNTVLIDALAECKIPYMYENLLEDDHGIDSLVNRAVKHVQNNWFIVCNSYMDTRLIQEYLKLLKGQENNVCALYSDSPCMCINKWAFKQLLGNVEKPWFDKLKEFENWQDACIKIS